MFSILNKCLYLGNHSSERVHFWDSVTFEDLLLFHKHGLMLRVGFVGQNLGCLYKVLCHFQRIPSKDSGKISVRYVPLILCHKVKVRVAYISWSSDFALNLKDYSMDENHTRTFVSVWHKDWLHTKHVYVGQWPIHYGLVILPYNF